MTINDIAAKLEIDRNLANGLVTFLRKKNLLVKVGEQRPAGGKGKPSAVYKLADDAGSQMVEILSTLQTQVA